MYVSKKYFSFVVKWSKEQKRKINPHRLPAMMLSDVIEQCCSAFSLVQGGGVIMVWGVEAAADSDSSVVMCSNKYRNKLSYQSGVLKMVLTFSPY